MPCPHFSIKIIKRSSNQSAVAGAAYQSGSNLFSEYDMKRKNYSGKKEVIHSEIMLPIHAPPEYQDRQQLWNSVEAVENQWNSQLARRIELALPREVPQEQYIQMMRDFCEEHFVSKGMCVDFAIHDDRTDPSDMTTGNPHAHIMLTLRGIDEKGNWMEKSRKEYVLDEKGERIKLKSGNYKSRKVDVMGWNKKENSEIWRHGWEQLTNRYLEANERPERIDLRSYEKQGIEKIPMIHLGPAVTQMEREGIKTNLGNLNRDIRKTNAFLKGVRKIISELETWLKKLNSEMEKAGDKNTEKKISLPLKEFRQKLRSDLEASKKSALQNDVKSTVQTKQKEDAPKEKTIPLILMDYMDERKSEREGWSNYGKNKGVAADLKKVSNAIGYLSGKNIRTVSELEAYFTKLKEKYRPIEERIKTSKTRIEKIDNILAELGNKEKYQDVHDAYSKIGWKMKKEKYAKEHKGELEIYNRADRYLRKNSLKTGENKQSLMEERYELKKSNEGDYPLAEAILEEFKMLKEIKSIVAKIAPELTENLDIETKTAPAGKKSISKAGEKSSTAFSDTDAPSKSVTNKITNADMENTSTYEKNKSLSEKLAKKKEIVRRNEESSRNEGSVKAKRRDRNNDI